LTSYLIKDLILPIVTRLRSSAADVESDCQGAHDSSPAKFKSERGGVLRAEVAAGAAPNANPLRPSVHKEAGRPGNEPTGSALTLGVVNVGEK
jgi:hypothetical protein